MCHDSKTRYVWTLALAMGASPLPLFAQDAEPPVAETPRAVPSEPAAQTPPTVKPAPVVEADAKVEVKAPEASDDIRFQFEGMPYADVVKQFAQMAGKPILGDVSIDGELTFFDSQPYTYEEALETLNIMLAMQGQILIESGRYLKLVPVGDLSEMKVPIISGTDEADAAGLRPGDLVTMFLPVNELNVADAAKAIVPMVSIAGKIAPLEKGAGILITDRLDNIKRIRALLTMIDQKKADQARKEQELKSYALQRAAAGNAAMVVNTLLKPAAAGRRDEKGESAITAAADVRSNVLMLYGTKDMLAMADQLVLMLDGENAGAGSNLRVFGLKTAAANDVANALLTMFGGKSGAQGVFVYGDATMNSVLVRAGFEDMKAVEEMIMKLDQNVQQFNGVRAFHLEKANASALIAVVQGVLVRRNAKGEATGATVSATADAATNTLYISGSPEALEMADKLIAELDKDMGSDEPVVTVRLTSANAASLAQTLATIVKADSNAAGSVFIGADASSNTVLIRAPGSQREKIEALIAKLDESAKAGAREMRTFQLKNVSAAALTPMLAQLYAAPKSAAEAAAPGDRTLIVEAPREQIEEIAGLIEAMDREDSQVNQEVRAYRLTTARAPELFESLRRLYAQPQGANGEEVGPRFGVNTAANQLLVSAAPAQFAAIEKTIQEADKALDLLTQTRTFRLKFARAAEVVTVLQGMIAEEGAKEGTGLVRVGAMEATNDVVVQGPPDKLALAEQLIKTFDSEEAQTQTAIELVKLENAQAASLADAVTALIAAKSKNGEAEVTISPEPNSNSVLVRGPVGMVRTVVETIKKLDSQSDSGITQMRVFRVEQGSAEELAESLEKVFNDMIRQTASQRKGVTPPPFTIAADTRTNSLVVSTTPGYFTLVEQLLKNLDQAPERADRDVQYFALQNADAFDVLYQIESMYEDRTGDDLPVVDADYTANSISVIAKSEDLITISEVVGKLDKAAEDHSIQVRVVTLKDTKASKMAAVLKEIYPQTSPGVEVDVTDKPAEPKAEVGKPAAAKPLTEEEERKARVEEMVKKLRAAGFGDKPKEEPAAPADPGCQNDAEPEPSEPTIPSPDSPARPRVHITVNEPTNSLIISGTRKQLDELDSLISKLSGTDDDPDVDFRIFDLKQTDPEAVTAIINTLFNPQSQQAQLLQQLGQGQLQQLQQLQQQAPQLQQQLQQLQQLQGLIPGQGGGEEGGGGERAGRGGRGGASNAQQPGGGGGRGGRGIELPEVKVVVVSDSRANRVIVRGSDKDLDVIAKLIESLDSATARAGEVRVFTLVNTQAEEVAANLRDLLTTRPRSGNNPARAVLLRESLEKELREQGVVQGEAVDMGSVISVTANKQTNSVIVAAPDAAMRIVEQVVRELDQSAALAAVPSVRLYKLKNAEAAAIVPNLQELLSPLAPAQGTRGGVVITADPGANMLIVAASPDQHALVEQVINDIDNAQPGDKLSVKVYRVQHGEAASIGATLSEILIPNAGPGRRNNPSAIPWLQGVNLAGGGATYGGPSLRISTDSSSNALIVRATDEDHKKIDELLGELDKPIASQQQVRLIVLEHADAEVAAQRLSRMFGLDPEGSARRGGARQSIVIEPDRDARMLLVRADEVTFARIEAVAKQIDAPMAGGEVTRRVIALKHGNAESVAEALTEAFTPTDGRKPDPAERVSVVAESGSNTIVVTANAGVQEKVDAMLVTLDADATGGMVTEFLVLDSADAAQLAPALTRIAGGEGQSGVRGRVATIAADAATNALVFRGPATEVTRLKKIASDLDFASGEFKMPDIGVFVVPIKNNEATQIAAMVKDLFSQTAQQALLTGGGGASASMPTVSVSADPRSNSLLVITKPLFMVQIKQIVEQLDSVTPKRGQMRVLTLKHADPNDLQRAIEAIYGGSTSGAQQQQQGQPQQVPQQQQPRMQQPGFPQQQINPQQIPPQQPQQFQPGQSSPRRRGGGQGGQGGQRPTGNPRGAAAEPAEGYEESYTQFVPGPVQQQQPVQQAPQQPGTTTVQGFSSARVSATAMPQQRAILIDATDEDFEAIKRLAEAMDEAAAGTQRKIHVMIVAHVNSANLATSLNSMYSAAARPNIGDDQVTITPLDGTDAIMIAAVVDKLPEVQALVKQLDIPGGTVGGVVRIIPLKNADANRVKSVLDSLYGGAAAEALPNTDRPTIAVDTRTNSLVISASEKTFLIVEALLAKVDSPVADPSVQLDIVALKHNDAGVIGPSIVRLFQSRLQSTTPAGESPAAKDQVAIEIDTLSNALVISANKENIALIKTLVARLDIEPPTEGGVIRLYPLEHTDAARVASVLQSLISQGLYKPGATAATNAAQSAREKVAIETDQRTNVLIVSASKENFTIIEQIIKQLDQDKGFNELADIRLYTLKFADAALLAPVLQNFFTSKRTAEETVRGEFGKPTLPVNVTADERTNTLLVTGSPEHFKTVEAMLLQLDTESLATAGEFRIFPLKQGTATALQPTLQQLFDQRAARGTTKNTVTILADARSNSLIVGASGPDMRLAESMIQRLDVAPDSPDSTLRVFALVKADANQVATTLRNLYPAQGGEAAATVGISVDERLNALIVSAGPADLARIEDLIKQLDSGSVEKITEIRVFTLQFAEAEELATLLTATLTQKPMDPSASSTTTAAVGRQTLLQLVTQEPSGKDLINRALQEGVLVTPDKRTNSLVVSAPLDYMPLLARLIKQLDTTTPREAEIRMFKLTNADATQMSEVLTALFKLQLQGEAATGETDENERAIRYTLISADPDKPIADATLGSAEKHALTVTVDTRTNSLIVGGTVKYVDLASHIITDLDSSPAQERKTQIYRLRHGQAADIQSAINEFLDQEQQQITEALGDDAVGAAQRMLERQVAVVAEETSNSLLVSASPRYFSVIDGMIEQLDAPKPQVLIQATLAEVTLSDDLDLGFEATYTKKIGDKEVLSAGTDFGVEDAFNTFGGMGVSVTGGDFSFFLRALQSQGKVEILSRPQILASDNQPAEINVGQEIPIPTNTRVSDTGVVTNSIEYRQVGIILQVTARLTDEGFVQMDVRPEISSLSDSTVPISAGVDAVILNKRFAETTVTVQDGHTIVIGGLITSTDSETEKKVPLLGDIPVLGHLFKSTSVGKERTELLIILTPRIIRSVEDADAITREQQDRLELLKSTDPEKTGDVLELKGDSPAPYEGTTATEPVGTP